MAQELVAKDESSEASMAAAEEGALRERKEGPAGTSSPVWVLGGFLCAAMVLMGLVSRATAWQLAVDLSAERHGVAEEVPVSLWHLPSAVLIYVWADGHFYWQHRLMHYPVLYKLFHKVRVGMACNGM